jgi:hypothetical protein
MIDLSFLPLAEQAQQHLKQVDEIEIEGNGSVGTACPIS